MSGGGTRSVVAPRGADRRLFCCLLFLGLATAGCVVRKLAVAINDGETAGPMIRAVQGRMVVVATKNALVMDDVPLHFHGGVGQVGTRWEDGAEGVITDAEYPVTPGDDDTNSTFVDMAVVGAPPDQAEPFTCDDDYPLHNWCDKSTDDEQTMHMVWPGAAPRSLPTNGHGWFTNCLAAQSPASCNATCPKRAPRMGFLYPLNFQAQLPEGDGATRFNLPVIPASRVLGATRTDSSPQAAPPPPPTADNSSHHVATALNTDHLFDHLQYSSNNGLEVAVTTTMIAVLIDLADKKKKSGRGRGSPVAVDAMALVMLLAVAALVNPTAAARPLYGGGGAVGHDEAAAAPAVTVAVLNNAAAGHSGCTNDPNTLEPVGCVHH